KLVLAGLERTEPAIGENAGDEGPGMRDDAVLAEFLRHTAEAGAARYDQSLAGGKRAGTGVVAPGPECDGGKRQNRQQHRATQPAPSRRRRHSGRLREDERRVGAAEPEGVGEGVADRPLLGLERHEIDVAAR